MQLSTQNVLHPRQVQEISERKAQLKEILNAPPHIRGQLQDNGKMIHQQMKEAESLMGQAAKPFSDDELSEAVKTEETLRESWLEGMPTQAEMRKNPPGAVDKNINWEKRKKQEVLQWKNLCRRLHASGVDASDNDVSNIEMYRPSGGSGEMSMDNAQITGKQWNIPSFDSGLPVVFTDNDKEALSEIDPDIASQLALMDNDQRAKVKEFLLDVVKPPKVNRGWTPERKAEASAKAKAYHASKNPRPQAQEAPLEEG